MTKPTMWPVHPAKTQISLSAIMKERDMKFELSHDKTNVACAPSEDSGQPGHPPSLIRVFDVSMKKFWVLNYPLSAQ